VAFSLATGEPVSWQRTRPGPGWYAFACAYVDMKWDAASAKYRRSIARALAAATPALVTGKQARQRVAAPGPGQLGVQHQAPGVRPADVAGSLAWLAGNTSQVGNSPTRRWPAGS
jgi:hypothetical protein